MSCSAKFGSFNSIDVMSMHEVSKINHKIPREALNGANLQRTWSRSCSRVVWSRPRSWSRVFSLGFELIKTFRVRLYVIASQLGKW